MLSGRVGSLGRNSADKKGVPVMAAPVVPIRPETGDLTAAAGRALTTVHRYRGRTCNGTVSYVKAVR
jgi:hypothetical protein